MNLNIDAEKKNTYDAIVVGTGISGGWAAKELTEKGLKTLVLERGRMVKHPDYPTATKDPWDFENGRKTDTRRSETTRSSGPYWLYYSPGDKTLVCKRFGKPIHRSKSLRLDERISRRGKIAYVGTSKLSL